MCTSSGWPDVHNVIESTQGFTRQLLGTLRKPGPVTILCQSTGANTVRVYFGGSQLQGLVIRSSRTVELTPIVIPLPTIPAGEVRVTSLSGVVISMVGGYDDNC